MISYVAVAFALVLLSVVDVWKLELKFALCSITAAVGALTLAMVIKISWSRQRSMPDTKMDKLETPHFRPSLKKRQELADDSLSFLNTFE